MVYNRKGYRNNNGYQKSSMSSALRARPRRGRLQTARKMMGEQPETMVDKIARYVGPVGEIAKTVSTIASLINVEDKFVDSQLDGVIDGTGAYSIPLNLIAQGDDYNERNGNKVEMKCLQLRFSVIGNFPEDTTFTSNASFRVQLYLLIDKKPELGAPAYPFIFPVPSIGYTDTMIDKNNVGERYVILKKWRFVLEGAGRRTVMIDKMIRLERLHVQWHGPLSGAFESGSISLVGISSSVTAPTDPVIQGYSRFCYHDN